VLERGKTQYPVKPNTYFNTTIFLEIIYNGNRYESRPIRRLRFCTRCKEKTVSFTKAPIMKSKMAKEVEEEEV